MVLLRVFLVAVACAGLLPEGLSAQTVRFGTLVRYGTSFGVDVGLPLGESFQAFVAVRGLDDGLECLGLGTVRPCTASGMSFGLGLRGHTYENTWGAFAELYAGGHRYVSDDTYRMAGGVIGLSVRLGSRVSLDVGYESRLLGADRLEAGSSVPAGNTYRLSQGLRGALGLRLGS